MIDYLHRVKSYDFKRTKAMGYEVAGNISEASSLRLRFARAGIGCTVYLSYFNGCCGCCVIHNISTENEELVEAIIADCMDFCRDCKYSLAFYTTATYQETITKVLQKLDWQAVDSFINARTYAGVTVYTHKL